MAIEIAYTTGIVNFNCSVWVAQSTLRACSFGRLQTLPKWADISALGFGTCLFSESSKLVKALIILDGNEYGAGEGNRTLVSANKLAVKDLHYFFRRTILIGPTVLFRRFA